MVDDAAVVVLVAEWFVLGEHLRVLGGLVILGDRRAASSVAGWVPVQITR